MRYKIRALDIKNRAEGMSEFEKIGSTIAGQKIMVEKLFPLAIKVKGLKVLAINILKQEMLARGGGAYFADNRLTVADLKVFVQIRSLLNGTLDHVPTDLVLRLAPNLVKHHARVESDPAVAAYYRSRS